MKEHITQKKNTLNHVIPTLEVETSRKVVSVVNFFQAQFGIIEVMILTYLYLQKDILFEFTGKLRMLENMHWYQIFLIFIVLRMFIILLTYHIAEFIKNSTRWNETKKKRALQFLGFVNLWTIPINLSLLGTFFAYLRGQEILSNNYFLGSLRRILNPEERLEMYQETIKKFLQNIEASTSKEIQDKLRTWAVDNTNEFLKKYDDGSTLASEYVSEQLKLELQKNVNIEDLVKNTKKAPGFGEIIIEKTIDGLNYFNPWVADWPTCVLAWTVLIGTGCLMFVVAKNNQAIWNYIQKKSDANPDASEAISAQDLQDLLTTETIKKVGQNSRLIASQVIKVTELETKVDTKVTELETKVDTKVTELETQITGVETQITEVETQITSLQALLTQLQTKLVELGSRFDV
jgi:uncharacterized coiled-coil protein SlyX